MPTRKKKIIGNIALTTIIMTALLTYVHNFSISELTRTRNTAYEGWLSLLTNGKVLNEVSNGDSIISSTSNDAFEQNAGFIYGKTGIRLTYLFNSGILWPNINECSFENCELASPNIAIRQTLINITRNTKDSKEWINQSSNLRNSNNYKVWYSDYIDFGQETLLFFIVPFSNPEVSTLTDPTRIKVYLIYRKNPVANPKIGNVCYSDSKIIYKSGNLAISSYETNLASEALDFRALKATGC
jgi:hypothetical protein